MDMRYEYYAIREWSVQGTCMCNGHGTCAPREEEQLAEGKVQLVVSMVMTPNHTKPYTLNVTFSALEQAHVDTVVLSVILIILDIFWM